MSSAKVIPLRPRAQAAAERIVRRLGPNLLTAQDIMWILRLVESELQARRKSGRY